MESNITICYCMKVSKQTVVEAVRNGATNLSLVIDQTGAGGGCGRCSGNIQKVIDSEKN